MCCTHLRLAKSIACGLLKPADCWLELQERWRVYFGELCSWEGWCEDAYSKQGSWHFPFFTAYAGPCCSGMLNVLLSYRDCYCWEPKSYFCGFPPLRSVSCLAVDCNLIWAKVGDMQIYKQYNLCSKCFQTKNVMAYVRFRLFRSSRNTGLIWGPV